MCPHGHAKENHKEYTHKSGDSMTEVIFKMPIQGHLCGLVG